VTAFHGSSRIVSSSPSFAMAARGPALNPSSLPFFPGAPSLAQEDHQTQGIGGGVGPKIAAMDFMGASGHSREFTSTTDYLSFRSSPSPPNMPRTESPESTTSASRGDAFSPPQRVNSARFHPISDSVVTLESSMVGSLSDKEVKANDTPMPTPDSGALPSVLDRELLPLSNTQQGTQPISILRAAPHAAHQEIAGSVHPYVALRSSSTNFMMASSPASSTGESRGSTGVEYLQGLDAQLKASPFINDILDRLIRCEISGREIRQELGEVHRKVEFLVRNIQPGDHAMKGPDRPAHNTEPTFRNPFAPSASPLPPTNGSAFSGGNNLSTTSPPHSQDEIAQISQRLNTLTTSVSQLLALQTQHHIQSINSGLPSSQPQQSNPGSVDGLPGPNPGGPPGPLALSNRPDLRPNPRAPNPPMRTWSAGSLDLPMRPQDPNNIGLGRPDSFLRDKRRSVANLMRRDSASSLVSTYGVLVSHWLILRRPRSLTIMQTTGMDPPAKLALLFPNGNIFHFLQIC